MSAAIDHLGWIDHLVIAPVALPLVAGALLAMLDERRRRLRAVISVTSALAVAALALALLYFAHGGDGAAPAPVYLLGSWPAPFGIVLVADRLSALMLLLASLLAASALVYSLAGWHRVGAGFHPLFQFLLMGLAGAFLTGDVFNLFVFFEVMLAASYGLALHGSGAARVRAGLHYIAVNLTASMLFLIGVSLVYGATGTLNMADLAVRIPALDAGERPLLEAGAAITGIAFLVKAAAWPLCFWLVPIYSAASAPVAAVFSIMSKVGVYAVLRLWLLLFGAEAGASAGLGAGWLLAGGMMTLVFGIAGMLASQDLGRLAAFSVLVSSGTLLAAIALGEAPATAGALYYLVSSTIAISAFFLLIELVERGRPAGADLLAVTREAFGDPDGEDPEDEAQPGVPIPATMAILGLSFLACALLLAGLPPLPGFLAKFAILAALFPAEGTEPGPTAWLLLALLLLSGLAAVIAMMRAGIRTFWASLEHAAPRVGVVEMAPIAILLLLCALLTVYAGPAMRYMDATAQSLHAPSIYIEKVMPGPPTVRPRTAEGS